MKIEYAIRVLDYGNLFMVGKKVVDGNRIWRGNLGSFKKMEYAE